PAWWGGATIQEGSLRRSISLGFSWAWSVGLLSAGIPPGSGRRSGLVLRRARGGGLGGDGRRARERRGGRRARVGGRERHDRRDGERGGRLRLTGRAGW